MLKWLIALPFAAFILFNAYVYGSILTYRAVAPHPRGHGLYPQQPHRDDPDR